MRREPILKICLNHALTTDIEYKEKDEKSWMFSANDFSTGEICPQQFCIRFANKNVAKEFEKAIEDAKKLLEGMGCPFKTITRYLDFLLSYCNINF
jgi:E3 SUMO-protein ligase RanBP2